MNFDVSFCNVGGLYGTKSVMNMKRLLMTFLCSVFTTCCFSEQKFPAWMDEAGANSQKNTSQGFNEPSAPIDPATGQPSSTSRPPGSVFGKPNLPDFSKMREKAIKAELEKRAASEGEIENSYSASVNNLDQLKESKSKLEALLAANPGENERQQLLSGLSELTKKLALSEEFLKLLGQSSDKSSERIPVASLTSAQFNRAIEIQQLLFPASKKKQQPLVQHARQQVSTATADVKQVVDHDREPTDEELIKARQYRPGQIKSFYKELKEAEQKKQEAEAE